MTKSLYGVYITPPGLNATRFGQLEAYSDDEARGALGKHVRRRHAKQELDLDSKLELVDPSGRWLSDTSQVGEHLPK